MAAGISWGCRGFTTTGSGLWPECLDLTALNLFGKGNLGKEILATGMLLYPCSVFAAMVSKVLI